MRKHAGLYLLLLSLLLISAFVNPLREMMIDDDWAYALSVRHLLATGEYRLHDWAAANMPVQIYWAALLARIFGYSFTVLRFSTLGLLLVAIVALYWLLRDFGSREFEASLLTLAVVCSPAVFFLSFTFQTDVQFLGWQILAIWLYSRALRACSYSYMTLACLAAAAAVGTRQFGVALVGGLILTWVLFERQRLRAAPLYVLGAALPLLMTFWQFSFGVNRPTFSQKVRLAEQFAYVHDLPHFAGNLLWRPAVILQYVSLFLLPLLPLLALLARINWNAPAAASLARPGWFSSQSPWLLALWIFYLSFGIYLGYFVLLPHVLMPYLAWLLPNGQTSPFGLKKELALTLITAGVSVVLGWLWSKRYLAMKKRQLIQRPEWFVVLTGLVLFGIQLLYAQFYDVYLIQFVPFAVFAIGNIAPAWPSWCKRATAVLCLVTLSISSLWTRDTLAKAEASWRAAELAHSIGAAPVEVGGNMTWSCYYGAFDEWIAKVGGLNATGRYVGSHRMHFAFFDFLNQRFDQAKYVIKADETETNTNAQIVRTIPYRDVWLRLRTVELVITQ